MPVFDPPELVRGIWQRLGAAVGDLSGKNGKQFSRDPSVSSKEAWSTHRLVGFLK